MDLDHVLQYPPQPSTVNGIGLVVLGVAMLAFGQIELGGPAIVAGVTAILVPDSSTEHGTNVEELHHAVGSLRAEIHGYVPSGRRKKEAEEEKSE